jgi:hypothetical protein
MTETSLQLSWKPPASDGGLPLKRYQIEIKDVGHPAGWVPLSSVSASTTTYLVGGVHQGFAYRFRVRAVNDEGAGEWLETDKSVAFSREPTNPSAPEGPLRMTPEEENAVRLTWHAPLDDGGVSIKEYIIETCLDQSGDHWQPAGTTHETNKLIRGLLPEGVYSFRISAKNEADKLGPPIHSELYRPSSPLAPPGSPVGPLRARNVGIGQVELEWQPPVVAGTQGFGAAEEYLIERYEPARGRWTYVTRQPVTAGTSTLVSLTFDGLL